MIFFQTTLQSLANMNGLFFFFFNPCAVFSSFTLIQQHLIYSENCETASEPVLESEGLDLRPGTFYLRSDLWWKEHGTVN